MRVVAAAADEPLLDFESGNASLGVEAKQPFYFGHDFRADAVAGKKKKLTGGHE